MNTDVYGIKRLHRTQSQTVSRKRASTTGFVATMRRSLVGDSEAAEPKLPRIIVGSTIMQERPRILGRFSAASQVDSPRTSSRGSSRRQFETLSSPAYTTGWRRRKSRTQGPAFSRYDSANAQLFPHKGIIGSPSVRSHDQPADCIPGGCNSDLTLYPRGTHDQWPKTNPGFSQSSKKASTIDLSY